MAMNSQSDTKKLEQLDDDTLLEPREHSAYRSAVGFARHAVGDRDDTRFASQSRIS